MIELKNVGKRFGENVVLTGVSAMFDKGTVNMVIGASGSGKSVLMKTMVGLLTPTEGSIIYDGRDFTAMDYKSQKLVRKEIGMLFQGSALFDSLTVEENVMFPLKMFSTETPAEMLERVNFCLERVNLPGTNLLLPSELSGGMKKRVGIARAIALNPQFLFCDEPNSGLDPVTSRVIDELLKEITYEFGITTVINSHDMKTVADIGDKIIFIHKGEKAWEGDRSEFKTANNEALQDFVKASVF